jgi:hypothetical protein
MSSDELNPFQSPQTVSPPGGSYSPRTFGRFPRPFASGHVRAVWAMSLLAVVIVVSLASGASSLMQASLLEEVRAGKTLTPEEAEANDTRERLVGIAELVARIGSIVAFLMWFHRVHRNLPALGSEHLRYTPGWAVGAWFVPILNLVRPCQIMVEVWKGSDPENIRFRDPAAARGSMLVGFWWALFIIMGFAGRVAAQSWGETPSLDSLIATTWASVVSSVITLPAGLLAILLVRAVDQNQQARHELIQQATVAEPAATWLQM